MQFDLSRTSVRAANQFLHAELPALAARESCPPTIELLHPEGRHNLAVGLTCRAAVEIRGHAGYFAAAMNQQAQVTIHGNAGWSVAENMMSGVVRVRGSASQSAGASAHGGLLVIEGDAAARCGISLKGGQIVVFGSVGHMTGFMAQAGTIVVGGDAGAHLGDSLYEATIYVRGRIESLGTDAQEEPLGAADEAHLADLLTRAGARFSPREFRRIASARTLYHWHAGAAAHY